MYWYAFLALPSSRSVHSGATVLCRSLSACSPASTISFTVFSCLGLPSSLPLAALACVTAPASACMFLASCCCCCFAVAAPACSAHPAFVWGACAVLALAFPCAPDSILSCATLGCALFFFAPKMPPAPYLNMSSMYDWLRLPASTWRRTETCLPSGISVGHIPPSLTWCSFHAPPCPGAHFTISDPHWHHTWPSALAAPCPASSASMV
mmetsp:Transcript_48998/g.98188  ORF Transcript_48998/g.98188 Transcript_48998/m.98188 type:complete len:209 (-) Transcript_48998:293-919(-)